MLPVCSLILHSQVCLTRAFLIKAYEIYKYKTYRMYTVEPPCNEDVPQCICKDKIVMLWSSWTYFVTDDAWIRIPICELVKNQFVIEKNNFVTLFCQSVYCSTKHTTCLHAFKLMFIYLSVYSQDNTFCIMVTYSICIFHLFFSFQQTKRHLDPIFKIMRALVPPLPPVHRKTELRMLLSPKL